MWGNTGTILYGIDVVIGRDPAGMNPPDGNLPGVAGMLYGGCNRATLSVNYFTFILHITVFDYQ